MSICFQKYHKNIDRIAQTIYNALLSQLNKLSEDKSDLRYNMLFSFFHGIKNEKDETEFIPNIYIKWYSNFEKSELNAIVINLDKVDFETETGTNQKATATYFIDFQALGNSDSESFTAISFVSGIIRETLLKMQKNDLQAVSKNLLALEFSPNKINDGTDNLIVARMTLTIETDEELTEFAELDGARANWTLAKINGGNYTIYREWQ